MHRALLPLFLGISLTACMPKNDTVTGVGTTTQDFVSICPAPSQQPFQWSYPPPHSSPSVSPTYACTFYRDDQQGPPPHPWGYGQLPWSVETCTSPTPQGKINFTWGSNIGGPGDSRCVMLTAPPSGQVGQIDFQWMAALGWRTNDGTTEHYMRSIELGPHTALGISDRARVDIQGTIDGDPNGDWVCQGDSHCKIYENGASFSIEMDHNDSITGIKPWSFWFTVGP